MQLPARIQRILSMVRADVKLPPCPCSPPLSLCCLAQLVQVPGLLPAGFSILTGKSGRAREEAGRLLLLHSGIWACEGITRRDGHVFVLYQVPQDHSVTG